MNKKIAFTLAETLIVIGIIGVVAALTLPNLNHATGDKETVTRVKKIYSALTEANDRAVAIYGPLSEWSDSCKEFFSNCYMHRIGEFLKTSKSCGLGYTSSCDGIEGEGMSWNGAGAMHKLSDGTTLFLGDDDGESNPDCDDTMGFDNSITNDICIDWLLVDINGPNKGKNDHGYDIFEFVVSDSKGVMPRIVGDSSEEILSECFASAQRRNNAWWIIENGNMDYLKVDSDGTCPDGETVLDGETVISCN